MTTIASSLPVMSMTMNYNTETIEMPYNAGFIELLYTNERFHSAAFCYKDDAKPVFFVIDYDSVIKVIKDNFGDITECIQNNLDITNKDVINNFWALILFKAKEDKFKDKNEFKVIPHLLITNFAARFAEQYLKDHELISF